jgi:ubiquinone/menaquinone biosynthesis C-methylase UbiE
MEKFRLLLLLIPFLGFSQYSEYDWEERDTWMNVNYIFQQAGIKKGSFVADIGCHEGYLSVHLAKKVGSEGQVFAVDVRADRLASLKEHIKDRDINNVNIVLGDFDNPKLPKNALDVVVIMDTYHEMTAYMTILEHVKKSLKDNGRIVIIEKLKSRIKGKSRITQTNAHSLGMKYVEGELVKTGFNIVYKNNDLGNWENDQDKVIWMIIAEKKSY